MKELLKQINPTEIYKSEHGVRRICMMLFSVLLMGFGVSVFSLSDLGVDPFTAMNMAISAKIGLSFGFYQMLVNGVLLCFVLLCSKKLVNLGTVFNMIGVGYVCEFFTGLYARFVPAPAFLPVKMLLMVVGVLLLSLAASLYFTASLGVSPYDAMGFVLNEKTRVQYKWCRVITDILCTGIAFLFAGPVGIGTVVTAFCMGPIVSFFNKAVSEKLLYARGFKVRLVVRFYDFSRVGGTFISPNGRFAA